MTDKELEKLAKAAFPNPDTSYDAAYWEQMESMLNGNGSKKGAFWWWTSGIGAILLGLIGLMAYQMGDEKNIQVHRANEQVAAELVSSEKEENGKDVKANNTKGSQFSESSNVKNQYAQIETKIGDEKLTKAPYSKKSKPLDNNTGFHRSTQIEPVKEYSLEKDKTLASGAETTSKQLDNSVLVQQREEESKNKTKGLLLATNESVDENEESKSVNERVSSIDYMPLQEINFQANIGDFDFLVRNTNVNDVAEDPAEWKPREVNSKLFYLEVVAGVDRFFHHASFVVNDLEQEGDYSTFSPQNALNLHLGVNGGIKWRNIYLQTGIHYAQFRQSIAVNHARLKTKEELEVTQKVVLTGVDSSFAGHNIIKVANGNGFSFEYQGAKWDVDSQYITTSDTTRNYSQYRENESEHLKYQLRYVQVPLFIGLEHQFKNHVLIECRLGVNFGFKIGERGEYYNPILEQYQTASAGEFSAVAMKGQFNFGLGYLLSPDLSIRLRPGFNYQIKGPFVNNELNKQLLSPSALGVELGLRYLF